MITNDFINFVHELFPSISPYTKEKVKDAIRQFSLTGKKMNCFLSSPFDYLAQGDIVEVLPFIKYDSLGNQSVFKTKGILISNTCDAENDDTIVFAPLLPLVGIKLDKNTIINNTNFRLLYFPEPKLDDFIIDLSLLNTFSNELITNSIKNGKIKKTASLSQFGYYLFLVKLTIHFMRPEDTGVQDCRMVNATE